MPSLVDEIRAQSAWVAARAGHVRIREDRIPGYAAGLPEPAPAPTRIQAPTDRERACAFWLTLDAINFGSGWFPTLRKAPGRSGYATIHDGLRRRFASAGPWTADELAELKAGELADSFGQDPDHELMARFAASLADLGRHLHTGYAGWFEGPVRAAHGSAVALVQTLAGWECFADVSIYEGRRIPFLKRAQIAAADLARTGAADFTDTGRLTMFADNLVPHVLRLDGVLEFDQELVERIARGELIEHGSPEEVEIRACAVHAVELLVAASPTPRTPADIDQHLWERGGQPRYKAIPRHRARCAAY